MTVPWKIIRRSISSGSVFLDNKFLFRDGSVVPKFIVFLSKEVNGTHYVICMTTSQSETYKGSYCKFIVCNDPVFTKETVIEVERCQLAKITQLEKKYNDREFFPIGNLGQTVFEQVLDAIEESDRIEEPLKGFILGY